MYNVYLFENAEDHYDTVFGGAEPLHTVAFPSREAAENWVTNEFNDSGWYYLHHDELIQQRKDFLSGCL
jgi:hypothetical protein